MIATHFKNCCVARGHETLATLTFFGIQLVPTQGTAFPAGKKRQHGLALTGERVFGQDYVRALRDWGIRFRSAWPSIEQMGFDERFGRLWEYYLAYSEAGFRSGIIDVRQMVFARQR